MCKLADKRQLLVRRRRRRPARLGRDGEPGLARARGAPTEIVHERAARAPRRAPAPRARGSRCGRRRAPCSARRDRAASRSSQGMNSSRTPGRRCSADARDRDGAGLDAGAHDRRQLLLAVGDARAGSARSARRRARPPRSAERPPRRGASGGGVPGSLTRQTSSSSVPIERFARTSVRSAAARKTSRSRRIIVDFVSTENGLRARPSVSSDAAREPVAALGLLVGIGVRAHRDVLAAPARPCELGREPLHGVDLDHDAPLEVLQPVQPEVLVGRPGEAVRAGVATAAIRVDRVAERHARRARHLADDRARADVQVLDLAQLARRIDVVVQQRCPVARYRRATSAASDRQAPCRQHSEQYVRIVRSTYRRAGMCRSNHATMRVVQSISAGRECTPWPSPG